MYHTKEKTLQAKFISLIKEKIPGQQVNTLMEILPLTKEAVYRRLRGDVPFSFVEMATLSAYLGISLDYVAETISIYRSQWYKLHIRNYDEFEPIDLNMSHNFVKAINIAADDPDSEFGIAANILPLHISLLHFPVYRIYLLKWKYQFGKTPKSELKYSDILVPEAEKETYCLYLNAIKKIKYTYFIWDGSFLLSLINDINYFHSIRIINREEMHMLKQEINRLLDTLESYADNGKFERTGNKIETYVSSLNFETTYSYLISNNMFIGMGSAFCLGAFTTLDKEACQDMKKWIQGLKKSSTLISGAAQRDKILFFEKQRNVLDENFIIK
ncbi:MAG: hypothetical protein LBV72_15270 [Tannerella sp.]|jgi:hypothetical protein|nr:hypothetical protein [Tannerella sp.]